MKAGTALSATASAHTTSQFTVPATLLRHRRHRPVSRGDAVQFTSVPRQTMLRALPTCSHSEPNHLATWAGSFSILAARARCHAATPLGRNRNYPVWWGTVHSLLIG